MSLYRMSKVRVGHIFGHVTIWSIRGLSLGMFSVLFDKDHAFIDSVGLEKFYMHSNAIFGNI